MGLVHDGDETEGGMLNKHNSHDGSKATWYRPDTLFVNSGNNILNGCRSETKSTTLLLGDLISLRNSGGATFRRRQREFWRSLARIAPERVFKLNTQPAQVKTGLNIDFYLRVVTQFRRQAVKDYQIVFRELLGNIKKLCDSAPK